MDKQQILAKTIETLVSLANKADDIGDVETSSQLDTVLAQTNLLKLASFNEGSQAFWILNGRAFELAWKEKRGKGEEKKSAQECWFEVLEEFQKALESEEKKHTMIEKYVTACNSTMSEKMTALHKKLGLDKENEEGETPGKSIVKKLGPKGAVLAILKQASEKLADGMPAGVAFYEALDHFTSGQYARDIVAFAQEIVCESARKPELRQEAGKASSQLQELSKIF